MNFLPDPQDAGQRLDNWLKLQIDQDWDKIMAAPERLMSYAGLKDAHVAALRNIIESRER